MGLASEMPTPMAVLAPALMTLANAVAVVGACTERLAGSTEATRVVGGGGATKASPLEK